MAPEMRILIAPDKFKGSLSARHVAENIASGLREALPDAEIELAPVADGGEGTAEVICDARRGEWITCDAHDALGNAIRARYVWLRERATAVVDMSEAAGLHRLQPGERDPLRANTLGVGEMMLDATERGAREIIVGLGGSATSDGGFGMAQALGFRFFGERESRTESALPANSASRRTRRSTGQDVGHREEQELVGGPVELIGLTRIAVPSVLRHTRITGAADVRSPLLGEHGAAHLFAAQKGATPEQIEALECALTRLADVGVRDLGIDFRVIAGAGAAGGLGFGLMTFCGAELLSGFDVVADAIDLQEKIRRADVVITGEGRLDRQTSQGKTPAGVARLARKSGKAVFAIVGSSEAEQRDLFDEVIDLVRGSVGVAEALAGAPQLLRDRAAELGRSLCRRLIE